MAIYHKIELKEEDITQAYFDATDLKRTLEANNLTSIKRVHGGTDNEDTAGDLIENLLYIIEKIHDQVEERI